MDESVTPIEYNFRTKAEHAASGAWTSTATSPPRCPDGVTSCATATRIFHTYSVYARGLESIGGSYYLLDETALGRQEEWEEPKGRAAGARGAVPDFAT